MQPVIHLDRTGAGTGTGWDGQVEFRADLPITIGDPPIGSIYLVEQKTTILLGLYTTFQSGLYIRDSNTGALSDWRRLNVKVKFTDAEFAVVNAADESKQITLDASLLTTATIRAYQAPDRNGILALNDQISDVIQLVKTEANLPEVSGNTEPAEEVIYQIDAPRPQLTRPWLLDNIGEITVLDLHNNRILYDGTDPFIKGTFTRLFIVRDGIIVGNGTDQTFFDLIGDISTSRNVIMFINVEIRGFEQRGKLENINTIELNVKWSSVDGGLIYKNFRDLLLNKCKSRSANSLNNSPLNVITGTDIGSIRILGSKVDAEPLEKFLQVSKNLVPDVKALVEGNSVDLSLGGKFFADAISGTATITDNGGGFVRITDVAHGITIEDVVGITGSGEGSYNVDSEILARIDDDIFDLNLAYVSDDSAGTYTTGDSNDFVDKFEVKGNGDQPDSNEVMEMEVAIPFTTIITTIGVPVEASGASGAWSEVKMRRGEFEADGSGRMRYVGDTPKEFIVTGSINIELSFGSPQLLAAYIMLNGVVLSRSRSTSVDNREMGLNPYAVVFMVKNDFVSYAVENSDTTNNIDINSGALSATSNK